LSDFQKPAVANAIVRIAKARYAHGYPPIRPLDPGEEVLADDLPVAWLTDAETIALCKLIELPNAEREPDRKASTIAADEDVYTVGNIRVEYVDDLEV